VDGEGVDIAWPTFSLVYATPLLQHQVQSGLNPTLIMSADIVGSIVTSRDHTAMLTGGFNW